MKCKNCVARKGTASNFQCLADIRPYQLKKSGELGCCCNSRQVQKYMNESAALAEKGE